MATFNPHLDLGALDHNTDPAVRIRPKRAGAAPKSKTSNVVIRRPNRDQGRGLEILGHAIEYLVDSSLYNPDITTQEEAIQILCNASLSLFEDCEPMISLFDRIKRRFLTVPL